MAIESVSELPSVDFLDGADFNFFKNGMIKAFQDKKSELTNTTVVLQPADDQSIMLSAAATYMEWIMEHVQAAGEQTMLKDTWGEAEENRAAMVGLSRKDATAATTTLRFTLSEARDTVTSIPEGSTVSSTNGEIYFETTEYAEIPIGETSVDVPAECTLTGVIGNGYEAGSINSMTDIIAYVESVANTTTSAGGTDAESDDDLKERIFLAPSSLSVAGPDDAYIYWCKAYNSNIGNVVVDSPSPVVVNIYFVMKDGSLPEEEVIKGLSEFLQDGNIRPLTDKVTVAAPAIQTFDVNVKYYINSSDSSKAVTIQSDVDQAVADYITWQSQVIGRDINPDELVKRMVEAGAKRVEITSPVFTTVSNLSIPQIGSKTVSYGGVEDD